MWADVGVRGLYVGLGCSTTLPLPHPSPCPSTPQPLQSIGLCGKLVPLFPFFLDAQTQFLCSRMSGVLGWGGGWSSYKAVNLRLSYFVKIRTLNPPHHPPSLHGTHPFTSPHRRTNSLPLITNTLLNGTYLYVHMCSMILILA